MEFPHQQASKGGEGETVEMSGEPSIWQGALPEALGGGTVALVLLGLERLRDHLKRKETLSKARFAIKTELRTLRRAAVSMQDMGETQVPNQLRGFALAPLVQVSMEGLGQPDLEAGLASVLGYIDQCNSLALSIAIESIGVNRAMGDHEETVAAAMAHLKEATSTLISSIDAFDRLVDGKG